MIEELLHRIERKLDHSDFGDPPFDRLNTCLAVHAVISGRMDCPRSLQNFERGGLRQFAEASRLLLFTPLQDIARDTRSALEMIGLDDLLLGDLPPHERTRCLDMIEDRLQDAWVCRMVHYEMARLTPFTTEDIARHLAKFRLKGAGAKARRILDCLQERTFEMAEHQARFPSLSERKHQQHRWDPLRLAQANKVEQAWEERWGEPSRYREAPDAKGVLSSLGKPRSDKTISSNTSQDTENLAEGMGTE